MDNVVNRQSEQNPENADMPKKGEVGQRVEYDPGCVARLHEACADVGVTTPSEFADKLGISRQTGYKWYHGQAPNISGKDIFKIADALGVTARWLLFGQGLKYADSPRTLQEQRLMAVYRVSSDSEKAIVHSWLDNQEILHAEKLRKGVRFTNKGHT